MIKSPITPINPSKLNAWKSLQAVALDAQKRQLKEYFAEDKSRYNNLQYSSAGLTLDLSRHHIDDKIASLLLSLAKECHIEEAIKEQLTGENINFTENRPALHTHQRLPINCDKLNPEVRSVREKIRSITEAVQTGQWLGYTGKPIKDVVNIGIGGSDLGPRMAAEALHHFHHPAIKVHFSANIDPSDLQQTLQTLSPETTLIIVASKSWSTLETLSNAVTAKRWICDAAGTEACIAKHFVAISSRPELCQQFGIDTNNILPMEDGVGGRYSLWSAVGLSIALATSADVFEELLGGAHQMDTHFSNAPIEDNLPLLLALLEIWYVNFWGTKSIATLPYNHDLRLFPDFLQQLTMESNGKSVDRDGNFIDYDTCPVVWGSAGTIGQHSFHQLLHQGTQMIPVDFILPLKSPAGNQAQYNHLISNCLAQSQALMDGLSAEAIEKKLIDGGSDPVEAHQLAAHKAIPGNRPSTIISMESLSPSALGALIALYEHKVFCQGIIWNINSFDQWGVELGKVISNDIYPGVMEESVDLENPATRGSVSEYLNILGTVE